MELRRIPRRVRGVEASRLGSDFVVLDAKGQKLRGLNGTGARVFELVDGLASEQDIASVISREFNVSFARALEDVRTFLQLLAGKQLVEFDGVTV